MKNTFYRPTETNLDEFYAIVEKLRNDLEELLTGHPSDKAVMEYVQKLIRDGKALPRDPRMVFWGLDEPEKMPSDARVDFFYTPTYLAVSIMAYSLLTRPHLVRELDGFRETLSKGLFASTGRSFLGHGYDDVKGLVECLDIFSRADLFTFSRLYPELCPEFTEKLKQALDFLEKRTQEGPVGWQRFDVKLAAHVMEQYQASEEKTTVFVYGTLMRGNSNHAHYLGSSRYLGEAVLPDYALYDLGSYPGIKQSKDDAVKGELYQVDARTLQRLDELEGEGSLYIRKQVDVLVNEIHAQAWTYIWNHETKDSAKVDFDKQPWRGKLSKPASGKSYVWYACYGSNLLKERFMHYIEGGVCRFNGSRYAGCSDHRAPVEDRLCIIRHELYFAKKSAKWDGGGVAFLNPIRSDNTETLGRMYLITEEQFREIQSQEGPGWYNKVLDLGMESGIPIKTITHTELIPRTMPSHRYLNVIRQGLGETYPDKSEREIARYIKVHITGLEEKQMHALHWIRKSPHRVGLFELLNAVAHSLEKPHEIIEPLLSQGYIRQNSRDRCGPYDLPATFYTVPGKREEIDRMLQADAEGKTLSQARRNKELNG